jgi:hypothetical protein
MWPKSCMCCGVGGPSRANAKCHQWLDVGAPLRVPAAQQRTRKPLTRVEVPRCQCATTNRQSHHALVNVDRRFTTLSVNWPRVYFLGTF